MKEIIQLDDYQIYIGDIEPSINDYLSNHPFSKVFVLVDDNTEQFCLPLLKRALPKYTLHVLRVPAGELHKNIHTAQTIWEQLMVAKADRKSLLINLGGGVIGDMGGFCAGTFKRGIQFVQIPTTLLSQVDASIGGKLGIDFAEIKNSIGLFKNPGAVFIDPVFLQTLSSREIRSGFAEIIKHSLINDLKQWEQLKQMKGLAEADWQAILSPSLKVKQRIVDIDPYEKGLRKALNFGHTIGHAVESYFLPTKARLLHGEAIAIGMICETYISQQLVGLAPEMAQEVEQFILQQYGKVEIPRNSYPQLLQLMKNDKKNEANTINFSCIAPIGSVHINQTAGTGLIEESLEHYRQL